MFIQVKVIEILEDTSATGGNAGAISGGDVYSIGINPGTKPTPRATGDLVLSPISTSPGEETGIYGIPVKKKRRKQKPVHMKSQKDGKLMKILNWDDYLRNKMKQVTYLKK